MISAIFLEREEPVESNLRKAKLQDLINDMSTLQWQLGHNTDDIDVNEANFFINRIDLVKIELKNIINRLERLDV